MSLKWYEFERGLTSAWQDGETRYFDGEPHIYGCLRDASCVEYRTQETVEGRWQPVHPPRLTVVCDCPCHNGEQL